MAIRSFLGGITFKIAMILLAMGATTGLAIGVGLAILADSNARFSRLSAERLPELNASGDLGTAANAISSGLILMLAAETEADLSAAAERADASWSTLNAAAAVLDDAGLRQASETVAAELSALKSARLAEFAAREAIKQRLAEALQTTDAVSIRLTDLSDAAYFDLVIGGEDTIASVETTSTTLIERDLAALRTAYDLRAGSNLAFGVALAMTRSADPALTEILRDLLISALDDLGNLAPRLAGFGIVPFDDVAFADLKGAYAALADRDGQSTGGLRQTLLGTRTEIDAMLAAAIDDLLFTLEINSATASETNSAAINALLDLQVADMRAIEMLNLDIARFVAHLLETAMAPDLDAAQIAQSRLTGDVQKLVRTTAQIDGDLGQGIAQLLGHADPASGVLENRRQLEATRQAALTASARTGSAVIALGDRAGALGATTREAIAVDGAALLTATQTGKAQFSRIAIAAAVLFFLAIGLTYAWIVRPIRKLTAMTERLAAGDLGEVTGFARAAGETGRLAAALRVFRDGLVERQALQAQVEAERESQMHQQKLIVSALADGLKDLSEGRLSTRITAEFPNDYAQLKDDFNDTAQRLRDTVSQIIASGETVRGSSDEISEAAQNLAQRTERSAAALEQSAAALEQLAGSINTQAGRAGGAMQDAARATQHAGDGRTIADETVSAMRKIAETASEVRKINDLIDDIAFQTNLLALNAGVEAARAGDAGRGFAVVASEVRALAQRTTEAAREISAQLTKNAEQIDTGVELVGRTGNALIDIGTSVEQVSAQVKEMAETAQDQANAVSELNTAISALDRDTQQNASMLEETTAASVSLTEEARRLGEAVSGFSLGAPGAASAPAPLARVA
ncbi:MAG: methyl-accepting chemotaxis protein [Rhodobacteraceae bacterium]|nr:methyl-accepting chemotaxis protein [Paracoccaceae bacterium]